MEIKINQSPRGKVNYKKLIKHIENPTPKPPISKKNERY